MAAGSDGQLFCALAVHGLRTGINCQFDERPNLVNPTGIGLIVHFWGAFPLFTERLLVTGSS
jgi:hypothetical protein